MVLSQLRVGETARIVTVMGGRGMRHKLSLRGLKEGKILRVVSNYGPVTVEIDRNVIAMGRGMAQKVVVQK
ncbi:MAG: FeoA family protein [Chloroflexota bacterium]